MQNATASPARRRELNTLAWVVFAGALIVLTGVFVYLKNKRWPARNSASATHTFEQS